MRKLEELGLDKFKTFEKNEMKKIFGGDVARTNKPNGGTMHWVGNCQQADVRKNDVQKDVGTPQPAPGDSTTVCHFPVFEIDTDQDASASEKFDATA